MRLPQNVEFHDTTAKQVLAQMLREVIHVEGPVHIEVAARRLAKAWELQRVGSRMRKAVNVALRSLTREGKVRQHGKFLWPNRRDFQITVRRPDPGNEDTLRGIEFIAPEELGLAVKNLVRDALSITEDELVKEVARIFGFDRTGANIRARIARIVNGMISQCILVSRGDRISLP